MRRPVSGTDDTATQRRISLERIAEARIHIDAEFLDSPQYEAESIGAQLGCRLVVKVESLNPVRSFKARGAQFLAAQLPSRSTLVCSTAGNFGQGLAYAARKHGHSLTVFSSLDANAFKVARMRRLGAEVRLVGEDSDETHEAASAFARESGGTLIVDGREPALAEGAGTIAVELLRWRESFDAILAPLGDGSLSAGVGRWTKAHAPATRIIGVCSAGAPAMARSWQQRQVTRVAASHTIADGLAISTPHAEALADLAGVIDDIILVDDAAIIAAMRLAHGELGIVLEPSGAAGIAALHACADRFRGSLVATILTGGGVTPEQMRLWLAAS
jgi:threonine dehydratase